MIHRVSFTLGFALLMTFGGSANGTEIINLGGETYCIPESHLFRHKGRMTSMQGGDTYAPIVFQWSEDEVKVEVSQYGAAGGISERPLVVSVFENGEKYTDRTYYYDPLLSKGRYSNGRYEYIEDLDAYKAYRNVLTNRWVLLRIPPKKYDPPPNNVFEFWLADCIQWEKKKHVSCTLEGVYKNHRLSFSVAPDDVLIRDMLLEFIGNRLEEWRQCA